MDYPVERIKIKNNTTVEDVHGILVVSSVMGTNSVTLRVGTTGHGSKEKTLEVGETFKYGPYTFGHFEFRLLSITKDEAIVAIAKLK